MNKGPLFMALRERLEKSTRLAGLVATLAGSYLGFCQRTTRWQSAGYDDLRAALQTGPVLVVMWHERSIMGGYHWAGPRGSISTLHADSPVARVAGALHRRAGMEATEMAEKGSNVSASRAIMKRLRSGVSIGMTTDGPRGPARVVQPAALLWAGATGVPVFCYAFATSRAKRLDTWDRMMLPKPFGRGAMVMARYHGEIPARIDAEALPALCADLKAFMDAATAQADAMVE